MSQLLIDDSYLEQVFRVLMILLRPLAALCLCCFTHEDTYAQRGCRGSLRVIWLFYGGDRIKILINQSGLIGLRVASKKGLASNGLEQENHVSSRWRGSPEGGGDGSWSGAVMSGAYLIFLPLSCCVLLYVSALYSGRLPSRSQVGCQQEPGPYPFLFLSIRRKRKYFPQSKVIFFSIIGLTQASNHLRTNSYKQGHSMHWLP